MELSTRTSGSLCALLRPESFRFENVPDFQFVDFGDGSVVRPHVNGVARPETERGA